MLYHGEVVGVGLVLSTQLTGSFLKLFLGQCGAGSLLEFGGFVALDEVLEALVFRHPVLLHRRFGRAVFFGFHRFSIPRILGHDIAIHQGGLELHVAGEVELREFVGDRGLSGVALP